jgi:hypothetical protein
MVVGHDVNLAVAARFDLTEPAEVFSVVVKHMLEACLIDCHSQFEAVESWRQATTRRSVGSDTALHLVTKTIHRVSDRHADHLEKKSSQNTSQSAA